jgi:predicted site-specific integrase-resolvase
METKPILSVVKPGEYARSKGVQPCTVWAWCKAGLIETIRTPGGQFRIVIRDPMVMEIIAAQESANGKA